MNTQTDDNLPGGVFIILPVLNEVSHIEVLCRDIHAALSPQQYTICFIDDGSRDGTLENILEMQKVYRGHIHLIQREKTSRGSQRGSALYDGMEWGLNHTEHDVFVEMDGDLSHRCVELKTGIHIVRDEGYDVAIASKFMPGGQVINRPLGRHLVSFICSFLFRFLITWRIKDYSNGYRFYSRPAAQLLTLYKIENRSPIYLTEVLAIWLKNNMRILEFASVYVGRGKGESKLRWEDFRKALMQGFRIAWRYHFGEFKGRPAEVKAGSAQTPDVD